MADHPIDATDPLDGGRATLDVAVPCPADAERVARVLGPGRAAWLGPHADGGAPPGMERYLLDLQMPVGERSPLVTFHKAAYVDIGPAEVSPDGVAVELSWRAAGMAPLFPVFSGRLVWSGGMLRLRGLYAPPGGGIGRVADRLLLNVAARGTARWLLARVDEALRQPG